MGLARRLYEQLDAAADDRARFRLLIDAIGQLEEGWPQPGEIARGSDVREAELRLEVQLANVRKEIEEVRKEVEVVRKEIEVVRKEIVQSKNDLIKWLVPLMFGQVALIAALVKLL
jgi:hypothetical protein